MTLQLTADQLNAQKQIMDFIESDSQCFVISGHAGTGKTTLIKHIQNTYNQKYELDKLTNGDAKRLPFVYCATTNKAAEALAEATGDDTQTIHSLLGLRVGVDTSTGENYLFQAVKVELLSHCVLVVDEASYVDKRLLKYIISSTENCKVILMGDPAQLTPVKSREVPVFTAGFQTAVLNEVVRQSKLNPIQKICADFRAHILHGAAFPKIKLAPEVRHIPRDLFNQEVLAEFTRTDWKYSDSKLLAWRNKMVVRQNKDLFKRNTGRKTYAPDDYVVNNRYVKTKGGSLKTDQIVQIEAIEKHEEYGCQGFLVQIKESGQFFMPSKVSDHAKFTKKAVEVQDSTMVMRIKNHWVDLRPLYACTVNKSQGSTYGKVYIDLKDFSYCRDQDLLARMLYVAISRAKTEVIFTGDLNE